MGCNARGAVIKCGAVLDAVEESRRAVCEAVGKARCQGVQSSVYEVLGQFNSGATANRSSSALLSM